VLDDKHILSNIMKIHLSSLLVMAIGSTLVGGRSIPTSLSKAAKEATRKSAKLRHGEHLRVRKLAADVEAHAKLANPLQRAPRKERKQRQLSNNYGNSYSQNWGSNYNASAAAFTTAVDDAIENSNVYSYFSYDGGYDMDASMSTSDYGFNITQYSFKYTGCSAVKAYSDTIAADTSADSVLRAQRMATFRLCPTTTCKSNTVDGCSSNYGEYVVSMDQFLISMIQLQGDRVGAYCQYCQECANIDSFKNFYSDFTYKKSKVLASSQSSYESYYKAYMQNNGISGKVYGGSDDMNTVVALAYYNKMKSGNYANNYVYGNAYSSNYYSKSSKNSQYNQTSNSSNQYQSQSSSNSNNQFNYYYGSNNSTNYNSYTASSGQNNQGQYQNAATAITDDTATGDDATKNAQMQKSQKMWHMWYSFQSSGNSNKKYSTSTDDDQAMNAASFYSNMNAWSSMASWYGHKITNGYMGYDSYGKSTFIEEWGFIGYDGAFHSLATNDTSIYSEDEWYSAYGFALPDGWSTYFQEGDSVQQCSQASSSSCYDEFFSCMQILAEDEYKDFISDYNEAYFDTMYADAEAAAKRPSMEDFLECTALEFTGSATDDKISQYKNANGGYSLYAGPHCNGDSTISIAVYTDQYCTVPANNIDIVKLLGYNPMGDDDFAFVPTDCISCLFDEVRNRIPTVCVVFVSLTLSLSRFLSSLLTLFLSLI
jgi:hypothetical protein